MDAVHEATKIPMDALKAIEEGYKVRNLTPFYIRGFIKIYAKYLGMDLKDVLKIDVDETSESSESSITSESSEKNHSIELVSAQTSDEDKESWVQKILNPQVIKFVVMAVMAIAIIFVAFRLVAGGVHMISAMIKKHSEKSHQKAANKLFASTIDQKDVSQESVKKSTHHKDVVRESSASLPATSGVSEKNTASPTTKVTLTVRAVKDSWFQVKADGKLVFQATLKSGKSESWTAKQSLEVSGKNINQLEYEVNGRLIGALGKKDRQAKKLVITQDGLNVTK